MYCYIIVDDESLIRQGIKKQLEPLADRLCCAGEAENGQTAIQLIDKEKPDIIILDMQMPIMDGTKLLPWLTDHYPDLQIIVISGYKDFDYIKFAITANAVDYVLKPFSRQQIQDTVLKAMGRLENTVAMNNQILFSTEQKEQAYYECDIQMLKNLILGYHNDTTAISSQKLNFINSCHNLILLMMNTEAPTADLSLENFLEDSGYSDLALYLPHLNNLHLGFIILFVPEHSAGQGTRLCRQIMEELPGCYIGVSATHTGLLELHTAFEEACTALNSRTLCGTAAPYHFYDGESEPRAITWDKTDEFLFRLEAGMSGEIARLIDELHRFHMSIPELTLNDVKFHYYNLTNQCWPIMNYYSKQYKPSISMQNVVKSIFSPEELKNYYSRFFQNLSEILRENSVYAVEGADTIEKIKIYIQRNYQKNLTIDLIASFFYLNASYFSHLFRQRTGEKFVDYLNRTRIERSKELLKTSDRKMYQIAKAVGYDNVKYFFRVFKKWEGVTPEQYRAAQGGGQG